MSGDEYIAEVQKIVHRQFSESRKLMDEAISDTNIPPEHHAMVRMVARLMMITAVNQKEERDYLLKELAGKVKL